jgi:predicted acetyltransferase
MNNLILRTVRPEDEAAFFLGLKEWDGEDLDWYTFAWKPGMSFLEMLQILRDEESGTDLPVGRVPATMLYGFIDGAIIGRVNIRHSLNERLRARGGHIGYSVAPRYRKKGYALEMLRQSLDYCKRLKLSSVMISCADSNVASWKIIEKNGGVLEDNVWDAEDKETIRRYWIRLL